MCYVKTNSLTLMYKLSAFAFESCTMTNRPDINSNVQVDYINGTRLYHMQLLRTSTTQGVRQYHILPSAQRHTILLKQLRFTTMYLSCRETSCYCRMKIRRRIISICEHPCCTTSRTQQCELSITSRKALAI